MDGGCWHCDSVKLEPVQITGGRCDGCRRSNAVGREIGDLCEAGGKGIDGRFPLLFLIVANQGDFAAGWGAPGLFRKETGQDGVVAYLA